jgi:hypothetical protein
MSKRGTCFERTFEIMTNLLGKNDIIPRYYGMMGIDTSSININDDILLAHGDFTNDDDVEEPHAWIEIKDQFVYETQQEPNPIFDISGYRENTKNAKRFNLAQTTILSHSEIANQVPWHTFDYATLASIQQKVSQKAQDEGILD